MNKISTYSIINAARYSQEKSGKVLLIEEAGTLLFNSNSDTGDATNVLHRCFSITKSIAALLGVIASEQGIISWDEPACHQITEWQEHPLKCQISIKQLLNMTSGLPPGVDKIYDDNTADKTSAALSLEQAYPPGYKFLYGPSGPEVFSLLLSRAFAQANKTLIDVLRNELLATLGIENHRWIIDRSGNLMLSSGAQLSARDLLKIGTMVRHNLIQQRPAYLKLTSGSTPNPAYGTGFWLNTGAESEKSNEPDIERLLFQPQANWKGACLSREAPQDLIAMIGFGGQRVYIVPSLLLTIVRLSDITEQQDRLRFQDSIFLGHLFTN